MKVIVLNGQTLADIALQEYGTVEAMPLIAQANGLAMSDIPSAGDVLECPDKVYDRYLQNYAKNNHIKVGTK